jgi:uncharacterized protein (DUF1800 family)
MAMTQKSLSASLAANRFGLGARPGELDRIDDAARWLRRQLEGAPPVLVDPSLRPSSETLTRSLELRRQIAQERKQRKDAPPGEEAVQVRTAMKLPQLYRPVYTDEVHARFAHAVSTDRPFLERLTQFWTNHFAVSVDRVVVLGLAGAMEREAIRPNVTGNFTDLLLAVEKHPAMLLYLDNPTSIGPNSKAAQFASRRGSAASTKTSRARSSSCTRWA